MRKIPVGETISAAYHFAFAEFLTVLGTVWLPYLVFVALCTGLVFALVPGLPGHIMHEDYDTAFFEIARIGGLIWLASIILRAMVTVGLQERVLGRAQGPAIFYFSLGAAVWRMIAASILVILLLILLLVLLSVVTGIFYYVVATFIPHVGIAIGVVGIIAAVCWYIYAIFRFSFFLPAVVVAENEIGIGRSWQLGGGNFWRIIAVIFVALVPVSIGFAIVQNAVVGPMMMTGFTPPKVHPGMNLHDI